MTTTQQDVTASSIAASIAASTTLTAQYAAWVDARREAVRVTKDFGAMLAIIATQDGVKPARLIADLKLVGELLRKINAHTFADHEQSAKSSSDLLDEVYMTYNASAGRWKALGFNTYSL